MPAETRKTLISEKRIAGKTIETPTTSSSYQRVKTYFAEMGVSNAVMPLLMSATGKSIRWLTGLELRETKIATDFTDGEQMMTGVLPLELQGFRALPGHEDVPAIATQYDPFAAVLHCKDSSGQQVVCGNGSALGGAVAAPTPGAGLDSDRLRD